MTRWMALGAAAFGVACLVWATDPAETIWCGSVGVGFLAFAGGLLLRDRRGPLVSTAGTILATVGGTRYVLDGLAAGRPFGSWSIVGAGIDLAALACVAYLFGRRPVVAWAFPLAFGIVLVGLAKVALRGGVTLDVWGVATVLALAGAALLAFRSPPAFGRALSRA